MLKTIGFSLALASTPLCYTLATPQEASSRLPALAPAPVDAPVAPQDETPALRAQLAQARQELRAARAELEECLDLLEQNVMPPRHRDCTPSRGKLTYYQWLDRRGHGERAGRALDRIVEESGREPGRLDDVARELMTDKETAGKFDRVALALVQRMLEGGRRPQRHLDTAALAFFLNGEVDRAVALQREAVAKAKNDDEYRRRLLTYEAAQRLAPRAAAPSAPAAVAKAD